MKIMKGETIEVDGTWRKLEVTYEEADFREAVASRNLNPDGFVNPTRKFQIMSAEVDKLLTSTLAQAYPEQFDRADAAETIKSLNAKIEKWWSDL